MKEVINWIFIGLGILAAVYLIGRVIMKAGLHELDHHINKQANKYLNIKKKEDNDDK